MLRDRGQTPAQAFPRFHTVRYYADIAATRCLAENYWPDRPTRRDGTVVLNGVGYDVCWLPDPQEITAVDKDTITIVIETGNAAFTDNFSGELTRILNDLAGHAERCECAGDMIGRTASDSNGNRCAQVFGKIAGVPTVS
jgi:hypothetical protein